jgi:hypothetical protein
MRAISTRDVPLETLRSISPELGSEFEFEVDSDQIFLKSAEPPSWVTFLADADWWIKVVAAYAALYIAEIVKEAGKQTWKSRGTAVDAAVASANLVKRLAVALSKLRRRLPSRTQIEIAIPIPDDYFCTRLELIGRSSGDLALEIALFVHHLPALTDLIQNEHLDSHNVAAGISLQLLPDASLSVRWQDSEALVQHTRILPFTTED